MAEIINLRLARKAHKRAEAARTAAENRARHGQSRAARDGARAAAERTERTLSGARRDPPSGTPGVE